ncbi:hypothetical protein KZ483_10730 [Paenibacillus sp. sptzw28]|uniref:WD40/YVTN/BNR-like repeat-containing protein n=1 Tax=Paenibacillus sp. sptzw28 TaxID=715179 RepID=UPI001C6F2410|nr:hypothetical protein [Paenibacillus sp. sptzw28]QYR23340.1 hypothetical protein KZ483_10730 [Paenibacillus sp. sptzw28]
MVYNSLDGRNWTKCESGTIEPLDGVAYVNGIFLAVGRSGTILASADGTTWTSRQSGTSKYLNEIAYGNGSYIVTGEDGTILTSPDGINWTSRSSGATLDLQGIAYGYRTFVAVGKAGTILQSSMSAPAPDNAAPITKYSVKPNWVNEGGKKYIKGYTVTLTATDNSSGVKITYYRINKGAWTVYTDPFVLYGSGNLDFYSEDNAGNKEAVY